jgi:hypothetical protein
LIAAKSAKIKVDNIHFDPKPDGTSKEALLRRLRKHAPDIHAELLRGEFGSVRAAAKAAGTEGNSLSRA